MPDRVRLPGANELFRNTSSTPATDPENPPDSTTAVPSGRVRHDEKITIYLSSEELLALESLRLALRRDARLKADRGRLVRAAIAMAVADVESHGASAELVSRLRAQ